MDVVDFISPERLRTYEDHTNHQKRAIALHNHTLQLGSSLMSMIALLELSLRNSTNLFISDYFEDDNWLTEGSNVVPLRVFEKKAVKSARRYARKASYAKLNYKQKVHLDAFAFPGGKPSGIKHESVVEERQKLFIVSHGQIISQTTFNFWKRLFSREYENDLWKTSIKRVFPNKRLKRGDIAKSLEEIYATRNRVAHHEPVYGERLQEAMTALEFIRDTLGASRIGDDTTFKRFSQVHYLRLKMDHESFIEAWDTLT